MSIEEGWGFPLANQKNGSWHLVPTLIHGKEGRKVGMGKCEYSISSPNKTGLQVQKTLVSYHRSTLPGVHWELGFLKQPIITLWLE